MSTFNGIVSEFPDIRVDFFRTHPTLCSPLAGFLSHIHSDHLAGLEVLKSPIVYCSAATKEMLLRLEKYPSRTAFANRQLETRVRTYKHLKTRGKTRQVDLLKALPLETPTEIELRPRQIIRVTLFDANHCPGAVMFLFEGDGKAALYTGDIRSEPWHVNALTRSPCLIEYTSGLKTLDKIYLDTSFTEDVHFQTKAEGLGELLQQVSQCPEDTVFYFRAWTFGYEEVWIALAKALKSKIHVDEYKMQMYKSLRIEFAANRYTYLSPEAPALAGFMCKNRHHPGCLTEDENVRLHSCEKGNYCSVVKNGPVVWIDPIIARLPDHRDIAEVGIGGGDDDFVPDDKSMFVVPLNEIAKLAERVYEDATLPEAEKGKIEVYLKYAMAADRNISLDLDMSKFDEQNDKGITNAIFQSIMKLIQKDRGISSANEAQTPSTLPRRITFPYSRHSSYPELCHLVEALKPKDVWPCTVSPMDWLDRGLSIKGLFGKYCAGDNFVHDTKMAALYPMLRCKGGVAHQSQSTVLSADQEDNDGHQVGAYVTTSPERFPTPAKVNSSQATTASLDDLEREEAAITPSKGCSCIEGTVLDLTHSDTEDDGQKTHTNSHMQSPRKRSFEEFSATEHPPTPQDEADNQDDQHLSNSQGSGISTRYLEVRKTAFRSLGSSEPVHWYGLLSTTNNHSHLEGELGGV